MNFIGLQDTVISSHSHLPPKPRFPELQDNSKTTKLWRKVNKSMVHRFLDSTSMFRYLRANFSLNSLESNHEIPCNQVTENFHRHLLINFSIHFISIHASELHITLNLLINQPKVQTFSHFQNKLSIFLIFACFSLKIAGAISMMIRFFFN
jgi:hypothetical protein